MLTSWPNILTTVSPAIALASALFSYRGSRIARKSLELAHATGQAAYETAKVSHEPAASLFLNEVCYRGPTGRELDGIVGVESCNWVTEWEPDSLEVVISGKLVNNLPQEVLLTCRDHPCSGRKVWYPYRNQSVFIIGGDEVKLGQTILRKGEDVTFTWIDRRPKLDWINIHNLNTKSVWDDPQRKIPKLAWYETLSALWRREPLYLARRDKVARSGFQLICESRNAQRLATIWEAEVVKPPVERGCLRDEHGQLEFVESFETLSGPIDDSIVIYRVRFDSTLVNVKFSRLSILAGRA